METAAHELQHGKALWLSHGFMFARLAISLALLTLVGWKLVRADLVPDLLAVRAAAPPGRRALFDRWTQGYDGSAGAALSQQDGLLAGAGLRRGLRPRVHAGGVRRHHGAAAALVLEPARRLVLHGLLPRRAHVLALNMIYGGKHLGVEDLISGKQRHDLGKLCFGFTVFWTYLMWAQFLVIWYGNLPEETGFVFARLWGRWLPVGKAVFIGMFLVPFFGLLGVAPKKTRGALGFFAVVSLTSLWLERYLLVMPSVSALPGPVLGIPEAGPTLLFLGLYLLSYALFARTFPMISPRLAQITLDRERGHASALVSSEFEHEESSKDYVAPEAMERRGKPRG
jgi:hypothetical protein